VHSSKGHGEERGESYRFWDQHDADLVCEQKKKTHIAGGENRDVGTLKGKTRERHSLTFQRGEGSGEEQKPKWEGR